MMDPLLVESATNPRFRRLLALSQSSRERRKQQQSVIQGAKLVQAAIENNLTLHEWFVPPGSLRLPGIEPLLQAHASQVVVLGTDLFRQVTQMANSPGPIVIIDTPRIDLPDQLDSDLMYLQRVQDPGNVGTILRSCAAAGVRWVATCPNTAFCWAPKVLRAAMGAHFALQIFEGVHFETLREHLSPQVRTRALVAPDPAQACTDLYEADLRQKTAWLCGSEGEGLSSEIIQAADERITIDQQAAMQSLNVAAAAAIALFEARRQRKGMAGLR